MTPLKRFSGGPHPPYVGPTCTRCGRGPWPTRPVYEGGGFAICTDCATPEDIERMRVALECKD